MDAIELAKQYAPILKLDQHEPFTPYAVGITIFLQSAASPSFNRELVFTEQTKAIIEYAIYWDYDIGHLYDLEHIWIYIGHDDSVYDCEASFHGKYVKGLLRDRSNIHNHQVTLFSQPGKHAFSPRAELFQLIPSYARATYEDAGIGGLLVTSLFQGSIEKNDELDKKVKAYIRTYAFQPAEIYRSYCFSDEQYMSWEQLKARIPQLIKEQVVHIESWCDIQKQVEIMDTQ